MKKKLLALLSLVGAGLAIGTYATVHQGIDEEGTVLGYTCAQLEQALPLLKDHEQVFYLVLDVGVVPPNQFNGKVIGDRKTDELPEGVTGRYVIGSSCGASYSWYYKNLYSAGGKRIFKLKPPINMGNALRLWCIDSAACDWLGEPSKARANLKALYPAQYQTVMAALSTHFARATKVPHLLIAGKTVRETCINGLLYGPGVGGSESCDPSEDTWVPFDAGKSNAVEQSVVEYTNEDLEEAAENI